MCGIAGWVSARQVDLRAAEAEGRRLLDTLARRGPDGHGVRTAYEGRIGFAHTRLAVIDPDPRSDQPLTDPDTGAFITYNGEIYNYRALRSELVKLGVQFATTSDTEVLLKGYLRFGEAFFGRLRGMYAFAIFDPRQMAVIAARDPLGLKPLYLHADAQQVSFGSSPQSAAPIAGLQLDPAAAVSLAVLGAVLEPLSPYLNVQQLRAGDVLRIEIGIDELKVRSTRIEPTFPWKSPGDSRRYRLAHALSASVRAHFTSDVPVAVFQSAGLDSTTISAVAAAEGFRPELLTVAFEAFRGSHADEAPGAAAVARALGLRHRCVYLTTQDLADLGQEFLAAMPTPTADAFNTYLAARLCRREGFKVALSGVGGDELFAGYPSFRQLPRLARLRELAASAAGRAVIAVAARAISHAARQSSPKLAYAADYLSDWPRLYLLRRAYFVPEELGKALQPEIIEAGLPRFWEAFDALSRRTPTFDAAGVRALETDVYMRNVLLRDADWAGMAHGVEIRTPLVDLPLYRELSDPQDRCSYVKDDLRQLANRIAPALQLPRRAKTGFTVPRDPDRGPPTAATIAFGARGARNWNRTVLRHWFGDWATPCGPTRSG